MEQGYLVNRFNWSLYLGLVATVGAVTILALPHSRRIGELRGAGPDLIPFFAGALLIVYGLFAVNLGQGERRWRGLFQDRFPQYLIHIAGQLLLALSLVAPFWLMFKVLTYATAGSLIWGGVYLFGYGFVLAVFGLLLGTFGAEIAQFQLKYLGFLAYLGGSFFWPPSSPFFNLVVLLKGTYPLRFVVGPLILAALGGSLLLLTQRRIRLWRGSSNGAFRG
ncbi:MAG: hypothetical protein ACE5LD_03075 [Candidatus Bipolaricaulia bacterium]